MTDRLRLSLGMEDESLVELVVEAGHGAFSGSSSAWVGKEELRKVGVDLQQAFPLSAAAPIEIEGGFWSNSTPSALEQRHVGLRFYQTAASGKVGVRVHLTTPVHPVDRQEAQSGAFFELQTQYEALRQFGVAIVSLVDGKVEGAELGCNVG